MERGESAAVKPHRGSVLCSWLQLTLHPCPPTAPPGAHTLTCLASLECLALHLHPVQLVPRTNSVHAKLAGTCESHLMYISISTPNYVSAMPANLVDPANSLEISRKEFHVATSLNIRKLSCRNLNQFVFSVDSYMS